MELFASFDFKWIDKLIPEILTFEAAKEIDILTVTIVFHIENLQNLFKNCNKTFCFLGSELNQNLFIVCKTVEDDVQVWTIILCPTRTNRSVVKSDESQMKPVFLFSPSSKSKPTFPKQNKSNWCECVYSRTSSRRNNKLHFP